MKLFYQKKLNRIIAYTAIGRDRAKTNNGDHTIIVTPKVAQMLNKN